MSLKESLDVAVGYMLDGAHASAVQTALDAALDLGVDDGAGFWQDTAVVIDRWHELQSLACRMLHEAGLRPQALEGPARAPFVEALNLAKAVNIKTSVDVCNYATSVVAAAALRIHYPPPGKAEKWVGAMLDVQVVLRQQILQLIEDDKRASVRAYERVIASIKATGRPWRLP